MYKGPRGDGEGREGQRGRTERRTNIEVGRREGWGGKGGPRGRDGEVEGDGGSDGRKDYIGTL